MKHKAKKHSAKKHSKKIKAKSVHKIVFLDLNASGTKIIKSGDVELGTNGQIILGRNDKLTFKYLTGTQTFALFINTFTPDTPGDGGPDELPFDSRVSSTDNGKLENVVKGAAKRGQYDYQLALLKDDGHLVTLDPQIIVQ
jgi:hypothetical protein